jgi:hypothetical protein
MPKQRCCASKRFSIWLEGGFVGAMEEEKLVLRRIVQQAATALSPATTVGKEDTPRDSRTVLA